jgi:hypothetical protein
MVGDGDDNKSASDEPVSTNCRVPGMNGDKNYHSEKNSAKEILRNEFSELFRKFLRN